MSEVGRIAEFVRGLELGDVPEPALATARAAILDTLACAVAGRGERVAAGVRGLVLDEQSRGEASLWGTAVRTSPGLAALANGAAAHALDYDDVSWALQGHPSAPVLPAVLAVAEARGASGADALLAYVIGFEVEARIGQALSRSHYARGWHPTSTVGIFGATAAAGRLLGLSHDALCTAFGIACSRAAGSRMNFGTDTKPLHAGFAARDGVECARLAARGVTAHTDGLAAPMGFADLYSGKQPLQLPELGKAFALDSPGVELKPYASCRFTHRTIDAVLALRERHPGAEIERLECEIDPFALQILIHPRPHTGLEAKFSLPYCAAVTWLDGVPGLASFSDERAARDDVQSLLRTVQVQHASDGSADAVTAVLASGERDRESVRVGRGHPQRPLERDARLHKVRECVQDVLGAQRPQVLIDAVESIQHLGSIRALGDLLTPP